MAGQPDQVAAARDPIIPFERDRPRFARPFGRRYRRTASTGLRRTRGASSGCMGSPTIRAIGASAKAEGTVVAHGSAGGTEIGAYSIGAKCRLAALAWRPLQISASQ